MLQLSHRVGSPKIYLFTGSTNDALAPVSEGLDHFDTDSERFGGGIGGRLVGDPSGYSESYI